jgi:hypothetical protein
MKNISLILAGIMSFPVFAGDLWEVASTSVSPDGTFLPYTQNICFPNGSVDPAQILGGLGNCTQVQENGNASAMKFTMSCKTQGMPAELASMNVSGDASLDGNLFNMNYVITVNVNQGSAGGNFKMNGKAEAHKVGQCNTR